MLISAGHEVVVVDNLFRGHREAVHPNATFYCLDIRNREELTAILLKHKVDAVLHFAAFAYVGESVEKPLEYYDCNVGGTISLLAAMKIAGVNRIVFSSSCTVYGEPSSVPITEEQALQPICPYGWSKRFCEQILDDETKVNPKFGFVALRYFNVAGCSADGSVGEDHSPETHLIPIILQVALGQRDSLTVFGTDYPTPDGSCIRDYIHVEDLCSAHLLALENISSGTGRVFNLGIGNGYSVSEVVAAARNVTGKEISVELGARRLGDPAALFADSMKIQQELGWQPKHTDLESIIQTAWNWFQSHPQGYGE